MNNSLSILQNSNFMLLNPNNLWLGFLSSNKKPNKLFGQFGWSYTRLVEKLAKKSVEQKWNCGEKVFGKSSRIFYNIVVRVEKWGDGGIWWNDLRGFCTGIFSLLNSLISTFPHSLLLLLLII